MGENCPTLGAIRPSSPIVLYDQTICFRRIGDPRFIHRGTGAAHRREPSPAGAYVEAGQHSNARRLYSARPGDQDLLHDWAGRLPEALRQ